MNYTPVEVTFSKKRTKKPTNMEIIKLWRTSSGHPALIRRYQWITAYVGAIRRLDAPDLDDLVHGGITFEGDGSWLHPVMNGRYMYGWDYGHASSSRMSLGEQIMDAFNTCEKLSEFLARHGA